MEALIEKLVFTWGPLGGIALVVFFALRKYGPQIIDVLIVFLRDMSTEIKKISHSSERQAESTEQLTEIGKKQSETLQYLCEVTKQHHDVKGAPAYEKHIFSTVDTNKALRLMCQAKVLETSNEAARRLIDQAIDVLTPK